MKNKIVICIFLFLLFIIYSTHVLAKYVIEETLSVATIQIDRTSPILEISYSTQELTTKNVEVTIKANEEIREMDGWILEEDKRTLKKEYMKNIKEEINIKDLSGNITKADIIVDNIDKELPTITIKKITNSNIEYENYANKDSEITFDILIQDDMEIINELEEKDIKILVNNKEINTYEKVVQIKNDTLKEKEILLTISDIKEDGNLTLEIIEGCIKDKVGQSNMNFKEDTQIQIDNTKPEGTYLQNKLEDGKIEAIISANEKIRKLDGWNLDNKTSLRKIFNSNLSYTTKIKDLAGNSSEVEINVTDATNVILSYASHNSEIGWSYGYGNYDIAGIEAIKKDARYKTESLAFRIEGNVEKDFLQSRVYVYTHWGEGSLAVCYQSKQIYYHGWNPSKTSWDTLLSKENVILEGKNYIQFGGSFINGENIKDLNGNNPIPPSVAKQYRYGISAIQLKLKDNSEYSIVYQIYVDKVGWINPAKDGEIECYAEDKPISALRIALVPKSEVNAVLETWNKDVRKINIVKTKNY